MTTRFAQLKNIRLLDAVLLSSFFLSGVCALMYQVSWQRSLYGIIGVDIDSITIIVSVFIWVLALAACWAAGLPT